MIAFRFSVIIAILFLTVSAEAGLRKRLRCRRGTGTGTVCLAPPVTHVAPAKKPVVAVRPLTIEPLKVEAPKVEPVKEEPKKEEAPKPKPVVKEPPPKPKFNLAETMGEKDFLDKFRDPCASLKEEAPKEIQSMCNLFASNPMGAGEKPAAGEYFGMCFKRLLTKQTFFEPLEVTPELLEIDSPWNKETPARMSMGTDFISDGLKDDGELVSTEATVMKDLGNETIERKIEPSETKKSWFTDQDGERATTKFWHTLSNDRSEVRFGKTGSGKDFIVRVSTNYHKSYKVNKENTAWGPTAVIASSEICIFNKK